MFCIQRKKYFLTVPQKPQVLSFSPSLMVRPGTGRPEGKAHPLALRNLQLYEKTANMTAAKERELCRLENLLVKIWPFSCIKTIAES